MSVLVSDGAFGEFGCHGEKSCDHHPKDCARSSDGDGNGDSSNISQSHRSRKGGGHGLKVTEFACAFFFFCASFFEHAPRLPQASDIDEIEIKSEHKSRADEQQDHKHGFAAKKRHGEKHQGRQTAADGANGVIDTGIQ